MRMSWWNSLSMGLRAVRTSTPARTAHGHRENDVTGVLRPGAGLYHLSPVVSLPQAYGHVERSPPPVDEQEHGSRAGAPERAP